MERDESPPASIGATLWLISNAAQPPDPIAEFGASQGLAIHRLSASDDFETRLAAELPAVVVWDVVSAAPNDWALIRRLHNHPQLSQTPFVLYQHGSDDESQLTSLIVKPASSQALWEAIRPAVLQKSSGSVVIVDDDPQARALAVEAVSKGLPEYTIRTAEDGAPGLDLILADPPSLVILDLMMPHMDGFEVLDRMRADERTRRVPVVILTGRQLSLADVRRLEAHVGVSLHSKGILSEEETVDLLHRALFGVGALPPQTSALARQAIAYLQNNFARPLSRTEIASEIGLNEDYLSRVFSRELGISPWDYLNRYRVLRARELLRHSDTSISAIARQVGFSDAAYFSRVFHRLTGSSPSLYRERSERGEQGDHPDSPDAG
jgi:AraC-like DNA-binding protein